MSATRIVFIAVCVVIAALVFTIGLSMQRHGDGGSYSITGLLGRSNEKRRKRPVLPKNASAYFTIVLTLAALALLLLFSGR